MAREPFDGSEWGERPTSQSGPAREPEPERAAEPALKPRRRLRRAVALGVVGLVAIGAAAGAAGSGGLPLAAEQESLRDGKVTKAVHALRSAHRRTMERLMSAPVLGVPRSQLEAIAECESGGDPGAVSSDGSYRGKYQFHRGTWASMGGRGDPAKAPELEQDHRAAALIKASGGSAWPNCG